MDTKKCADCNRNLPLSEFTKQRRNPDGRRYYCKWCMKVRNELYRKTHKEQTKAHRRSYDKTHKEQLKAYKRSYGKTHKEQRKIYDRLYRKEHKERIRKYKKLYRVEHKEQRNEYGRNKRRTDLKTNLNHKMGTAIRLSLKNGKGGRSWQILVGYTIEELKTRLQKKIPEGYNWQDFLSGELHIDHIMPISAHNFSSFKHPDFQRCWALSNLQLLPARENLAKSNKHKPFQPMLIL